MIFCILAANYFYRGISRFWLKYEARLVIYRMLAAIDRFSRISRKVESRWGKLESRWRKRKAVEESRKPLKKAESDWRRFSWISWKSESRWKKSNFVWGKLEFRRRKIPIFPRYSWVSGNFGVLFWHQICYHVCAWIYLIGFSVFQLLTTLAFETM